MNIEHDKEVYVVRETDTNEPYHGIVRTLRQPVAGPFSQSVKLANEVAEELNSEYGSMEVYPPYGGELGILEDIQHSEEVRFIVAPSDGCLSPEDSVTSPVSTYCDDVYTG